MNTHDSEETSHASKIDTLDWEVQPRHNLWPNIQKKIKSPAQPKHHLAWIPYAIAASCVLTVFAVSFSYFTYTETRKIAQQQTNIIEQQNQTIAQLEKQHQVTRRQLTTLLSKELVFFDDDLPVTAQAAMDAIDLASQEIKTAIAESPEDGQLQALLERTYQQEKEFYQTLKYY